MEPSDHADVVERFYLQLEDCRTVTSLLASSLATYDEAYDRVLDDDSSSPPPPLHPTLEFHLSSAVASTHGLVACCSALHFHPSTSSSPPLQTMSADCLRKGLWSCADALTCVASSRHLASEQSVAAAAAQVAESCCLLAVLDLGPSPLPSLERLSSSGSGPSDVFKTYADFVTRGQQDGVRPVLKDLASLRQLRRAHGCAASSSGAEPVTHMSALATVLAVSSNALLPLVRWWEGAKADTASAKCPIGRLCKSAYDAVDKEAVLLASTVVKWFVTDEDLKRFLQPAAAAAGRAAAPPLIVDEATDTAKLDAIVIDLAFALKLVLRYTDFAAEGRASLAGVEEPVSTAAPVEPPSLLSCVSDLKILYPSRELRYISLLSSVSLSASRPLNVDSASCFSPSHVEDVFFLSRKALDRAQSTGDYESTAAVARCVQGLYGPGGCVEDAANRAVGCAFRVDSAGAVAAPPTLESMDKRKEKAPNSGGGAKPTKSLAAALLEALDEEDEMLQAKTAVAPPPAPMSGSGSSSSSSKTSSQATSLLGGLDNFFRTDEQKVASSLCRLVGVQSAADSCRVLSAVCPSAPIFRDEFAGHYDSLLQRMASELVSEWLGGVSRAPPFSSSSPSAPTSLAASLDAAAADDLLPFPNIRRYVERLDYGAVDERTFAASEVGPFSSAALSNLVHENPLVKAVRQGRLGNRDAAALLGSTHLALSPLPPPTALGCVVRFAASAAAKALYDGVIGTFALAADGGGRRRTVSTWGALLLGRQSRRLETAIVEGFGGVAVAPDVHSSWGKVNEMINLLQVESVKDYKLMYGDRGDEILGKEEVASILKMRADWKA